MRDAHDGALQRIDKTGEVFRHRTQAQDQTVAAVTDQFKDFGAQKFFISGACALHHAVALCLNDSGEKASFGSADFITCKSADADQVTFAGPELSGKAVGVIIQFTQGVFYTQACGFRHTDLFPAVDIAGNKRRRNPRQTRDIC